MTTDKTAPPRPDQATLSHYGRHTSMSDPGAQEALFRAVPRDLPALRRTVQGLLLHEHLAPVYGVTLTDERRARTHLRPVADMLAEIAARDSAPLTTPRAPGERLVGVCRHFSLLLASLLRAQGIPARARCGFADYFQPGEWVDHWVCEVWDNARASWIFVDAQLDERLQETFRFNFDPGDVPRERFLIAGDAWALCRTGGADPQRFGIMALRGLWFVAGNVVRDAAALCDREMLPWDVWGAMPASDAAIDPETLSWIDALAAMTRAPDMSFAALRAQFEDDPRVRIPELVFNAVRGRTEQI